jgi:hypothetical protein
MKRGVKNKENKDGTGKGDMNSNATRIEGKKERTRRIFPFAWFAARR